MRRPFASVALKHGEREAFAFVSFRFCSGSIEAGLSVNALKSFANFGRMSANFPAVSRTFRVTDEVFKRRWDYRCCLNSKLEGIVFMSDGFYRSS